MTTINPQGPEPVSKANNLSNLWKLPGKEAAGPTPWSNWVIRGCVIAGAYPASLDDAETERILRTLLELGINTFVCLQAEVNINNPEHLWRNGQGLRPYIRDAQRILSRAHDAGDAAITQRKIDFLHLPILDGNVTSDGAMNRLVEDCCLRVIRGEKLYVHCWGGHGRTGTLISIMLGRLYNLPYTTAMRYCQAYHDARMYPQGVRSPQTSVQRAQVRRILTAQPLLLDPVALEVKPAPEQPARPLNIPGPPHRAVPPGYGSPPVPYSLGNSCGTVGHHLAGQPTALPELSLSAPSRRSLDAPAGAAPAPPLPAAAKDSCAALPLPSSATAVTDDGQIKAPEVVSADSTTPSPAMTAAGVSRQGPQVAPHQLDDKTALAPSHQAKATQVIAAGAKSMSDAAPPTTASSDQGDGSSQSTGVASTPTAGAGRQPLSAAAVAPTAGKNCRGPGPEGLLVHRENPVEQVDGPAVATPPNHRLLSGGPPNAPGSLSSHASTVKADQQQQQQQQQKQVSDLTCDLVRASGTAAKAATERLVADFRMLKPPVASAVTSRAPLLGMAEAR